MIRNSKQTLPEKQNQRRVQREVRTFLRNVVNSVQLESRLLPVEDEDGEIFYTIVNKQESTVRALLAVDDALIECAKIFHNNNVLNTDKYYKRIARMTHYALSEIEAGSETLQESVTRLAKEVI